MVKKQRGKTTSNTTDGETRMDNLNLTLDSSDDEAPEEVTFEDSKAQALRSMKEALDTARREKERQKEQRRRRQEMFQEQKKRKLLPTDVLEKIDSAPLTEPRQSKDGAEEEMQKDGKKKKEKRVKRMHLKKLKGNYVVTTMKERASASYQLQAAKNFIQSRLYGPGVCRTTSHELLTLQRKKGREKGAAVQFVRKNWASKEKAKAEQQKKRWVHKHQIVSC